MLIDFAPVVPSSGSPRIDAIAQTLVVVMSVASILISTWRKPKPRRVVRTRTSRPVAYPTPRNAPARLLDDLNGQ